MTSASAISLVTPLGDALLFRDLTWTETLGVLPEGNLTLLSERPDIRANDLLGQPVSVQFELVNERKRYFNGHVTSFQRGGTIGKYFSYYATFHPWLWFLTRTADCRIFLQKSVDTILQEVFEYYPFGTANYSLYGDYPKLTQCVQYRETDFNFCSRLMERNGLYYYFDFPDGSKQVLKVFDANSQHETDPHLDTLVFLSGGGRQAPIEGHLSSWNSVRTVQSGAFAVSDRNYALPNVDLAGTGRRNTGLHANAAYEIYDAPNGYDDIAAARLYANVLADEAGSAFDVYHGTTNAYDLRIGRALQVKGHGDAAQNDKYLVVGASFSLRYSGHDTSVAGDGGTHYECQFSAIPFAQQFRPAMRTPRPYVHGPQLATVTGPDGEEIYTDEFGRVKLLFHWDRYGTRGSGKGDKGSAIPPDSTSCWVPVAQLWAGNNFGAMFTPRIKQEVIVEFFEGDPDRPVITGRVYNRENPPPWPLPENKTQSGILTRSTLKGTYSNANMLRFEDEKGAEQLSLHAERDQDISVENDETHDVGHNRTKTIGNDESTTVNHNRAEKVGNDEEVTIGVNRNHTVGNNEALTVGKNRVQDIGVNESVAIGEDQMLDVGGNRQVNVSKNQETTVGKSRIVEISDDDHLSVGKKLYIEAGDQITLKTGDASLLMKSDGTIELKGANITIVGSGKVGIKASGDLVLKGAKITSN